MTFRVFIENSRRKFLIMMNSSRKKRVRKDNVICVAESMELQSRGVDYYANVRHFKGDTSKKYAKNRKK